MTNLLNRVSISCLCAFSFLMAQDVSRTQAYQFRIVAQSGAYALTSTTSLSQIYRSQKSCEKGTLNFFEPAYKSISNITASRNDSLLASNRISFYYPQRRDVFIDSGKVHSLDFSGGLKPGDKVSYTYSEVYKDIGYFPMLTVPSIDQIDRYEISVEHPIELKVEFSVFQAHASFTPSIENPDPRHTKLIFQNLPKPDKYENDPFDWFQVAIITKITKDGTPLTHHSPGELARWYLDLVKPGNASDDAMNSLLGAELAKPSTPMEKTRLLFDYVKSKVRYIADEGDGHAFVPHSPELVLRRKWGDCKDKAWLLTALARIHGLPVIPVLISTEIEPGFDEEHLNHFNHVICALKDGGKLIFMDPTDEYSEIGDPPDSDLLVHALVLDPDHPQAITSPSSKVTSDVSIAIEGDVDDPQHGKAEITLRHSWRSNSLRAKREMKLSEFEEYLLNKIGKRLTKIALDQIKYESEDKSEVKYQAEADLSDFFVKSDQFIYLQTSPFQTFNSSLLDRSKDNFSIEVHGPEKIDMSLTLKAKGFRPKKERITFGDEGGPRLEAQCSGEIGMMRINYLYEQPFRLIPAERRAAFMLFLDQLFKQSQSLFSLQRTTP